MISRKFAENLFMKQPNINITNDHRRNIQISIFGAASEYGSSLALSIKNNCKVKQLKLYDDEERVKGLATELNLLPWGPKATGYTAGDIIPVVSNVDVIVVTSRAQGPDPQKRSNICILEENAPTVQNVCYAMCAHNPSAFLALCLDPVNSVVPFAASIFNKQHSFNPFKLMGVTQIDSTRCKLLAARVLKADPGVIKVPVIGGHSEETVVPLFSNLTPTFYSVNDCQADTMTRLLKRSDYEILKLKKGKASWAVAKSYSFNEFCNGLIDAIWFRRPVELNCFAANPNFGTRYFAGPNWVGPCGITRTPHSYNMNKIETALVSDVIEKINRDVKMGEDLVTSFYSQAPKRQQTTLLPTSSKFRDTWKLFET